MSNIKTFQFNKNDLGEIREYHFGKNWPVVYLLENGKEAYVGETVRAYNRSREHYENQDRQRLKNIHIITDEEYNKSATLDIESWLIQYMAADGKYKLQNGNKGLQNHNYFDREKYKAKFEVIWEDLRKMGVAKNELVQIKNTDLFKFSPYKALTDDQIIVVESLLGDLEVDRNRTYVVNGRPGTGKTILAVYLMKYLKEDDRTRHLKIGLVVPMTSLRSTLKRVFRNVDGLSPNMVIGPSDVVKEKYDLLVVDESHRLKQRKNVTNFKVFDDVNNFLELGKEGTELDWVMRSSDRQIFFYDKGQSVRPGDVRPEKFESLGAKTYDLVSQMRISAGEEYINFIDDLFNLKDVSKYKFSDYDFKIHDNIHQMVSDIKEKDKKFGLSRLVAGYAWDWVTRKGKIDHDININGLKLVWNSVPRDWVNSPNAINEVGCIHTVQGYDLNYVGVIIGPELSYDPIKKKLVVDQAKYKDINGYRGISHPEELQGYIINIYKTLMTRGIKGTYVYVCDENLRTYLKFIN